MALIFQAIVVAVLLTLGAVLKLVDPELDIVGTLANVTVVFLLFIYALVIVSALKLRGDGRAAGHLPGQHPAALHRASSATWSCWPTSSSTTRVAALGRRAARRRLRALPGGVP